MLGHVPPSSKLESRCVRSLDAAALRVMEARRRGPTEEPRSAWRARVPLPAMLISVQLVARLAARVDPGHPRTHMRRELLEQVSPTPALVLLDPSEAAAVDKELREGMAEALQEAANRLRYVPVVSDAAETRRYLSDDDFGFGP